MEETKEKNKTLKVILEVIKYAVTAILGFLGGSSL